MRFAASPAPSFADKDRRTKLAALGTQLDALVSDRLPPSKFPGVAIGLVVDGDLVWSKALGVSDLASGRPVDLDTIFRLGSLTKSFTAEAVLALRDEGRLSLDAPAETYIAELSHITYPTRDSERITLRHLLSHLAGLPHDALTTAGPGPDAPHGMRQEMAVVGGLDGPVLNASPGVEWSYSNWGFELAGLALARASGLSYTEYVRRRLLAPLGMTSTGFDAKSFGNRLASGYVRDRKGEAFEHPPLMNEPGLDAAGGLWSSLRDLARWVAFQMSAWPPRDDPDTGPLRRSSVREAHRVEALTGLRVGPRALGEPVRAHAIAYGFGWVAEVDCELGSVVWHNGGLADGYHSNAFFLPDRGMGLVALTNLYDRSHALDDTVRDAAKLIVASGAAPKRITPVGPAVLAARDGVIALLSVWNDAKAARLFAESEAESIPGVRRDLLLDAAELGACRAEPVTASGHDFVAWPMTCDRGTIRFDLHIDPRSGRITSLHGPRGAPADSHQAPAPPHEEKCF